MRKHRKWLMGLGLGIMLGASMLELIHFSEKQDQTLMVAEGSLTREELEQAAKKHGFALRPANEQTYTREQVDEEVSKAVAAAQNQAAQQPSGAAAAKKTGPSPSPTGSAGAETVYAFYVNSKMDLTTIARALHQLGVIDDAEAFVEEARSISKKVQPGVSRFTGKPTYREIMAELTREKEK